MMEVQSEPHPGTHVGVLLRDQRLRTRLSLPQVAQALHIRQAFLDAIENGRFEELPAAVYANGFVRAYAEHLGLDPDEVTRRFKAGRAGRGTGVALNFPSPPTEGETPRGGVLLLGAMIAILAYVAWYVTSGGSTEMTQRVAPVPERLEYVLRAPPGPGTGPAPSVAFGHGNAPMTPAARSAGSAASSQPVVPLAAGGPAATRPIDQGGPVEVAPHTSGGAPASLAAPGSEGAPATPRPMPVVSSPGGQAGRDAMAAEPPANAMSADAGGRILLRARADSWVEVRDPESNAVLTARLLKAGEVYAVPERPGLRLVTGNAGGLMVMVDGQAAPPLGKDGAVRRGIPLEAEALRRGLEPAAQ